MQHQPKHQPMRQIMRDSVRFLLFKMLMSADSFKVIFVCFDFFAVNRTKLVQKLKIENNRQTC